MEPNRVRWTDPASGSDIIAVKELRGWEFLEWPRNGLRWNSIPSTPKLVQTAEALLEANSSSAKK